MSDLAGEQEARHVAFSDGKVPEEQQHTAAESFEIDEFREGARMSDMTEQGHADDGVDEGDQSQKGADVEQGR